MESWLNENYYTTFPPKWIHLMNLSTAEFGLAPFPPNLIAINDTLLSLENTSFPLTLPNNTIIIENAAKTTLGSRQVEQIVFLATSGLALLWGIFWLWSNRDGLFRPRSGGKIAGDEDEEEESNGDDIELSAGNTLTTNPNFLSAAIFRERMKEFYPQNGCIGIELVEKDISAEEIDAEDVEEVITLVRKMYETDLKIWALQNVRDAGSRVEREALKRRSDGILGEVRRRVVQGWNCEPSVGRWEVEERKMVEGIGRILVDNIPEERYPGGGAL